LSPLPAFTPRAREEWLACVERVLADAPARYAREIGGHRETRV
jgi:hypothetical protein